MKFRILGDLEAEADGHPLPLDQRRDQKVLGMLLLNAGRVVLLPRLVDALWDDSPPATAAKQVRNAVSRLRRLLSEAGAPGLIKTRGGGYLIAITGPALDSLAFEATVTEAEAAVSAARFDEAARLLGVALNLCRGPLLAGIEGRIFGDAAAAWEERRCSVVESYHDYQLRLGRHREILAELVRLAREYPLREKPAGQLMLALYRCGRRADALSLFSDTQALLAAELGLDPGLELQRLYQQILGDDPALATPAPAGVPGRALVAPGPSERPPADAAPVAGGPVTSVRYSPHSDTATFTGREEELARIAASTVQAPGPGGVVAIRAIAVPRQLPSRAARFVGRASALAELTRLLIGRTEPASVVISAIGGMAGVGKTALALHFAHEVAECFPDGQLYIDMRGFASGADLVEPAEAVRWFLDALEIPAEHIPVQLDAQVRLYRSVLAGRRVLIVLDNVRHASQVRPLLPGAPGCAVLVTSRHKLPGLIANDGARPIDLDVLTDAECRALLASRIGPDRLEAEPQAVSDIIARCGRLPLALAIVAARAAIRHSFPLSDLAAELRASPGQLDALACGDDQATDLRAVFSWSCRTLSPEAARLFGLLGLHPGPDISSPATASLAGRALTQTQQLLGELARVNMVSEQRPGRYACHDLLRAYAHELARDADPADCDAAISRLLHYYLYAASAADQMLDSSRDREDCATPAPGVLLESYASAEQALTWFTAEHQVLLAALHYAAQHGFNSYTAQISWLLVTFLDRRGHWFDQASVQQAGLAAARRLGDPRAQARAHRSLAGAYMELGQIDEALMHYKGSLELCDQVADQAGQAVAHQGLAIVRERQGSNHDALAHSRRALELYRAAGHLRGQARALSNTGWYHAELGDFPQALVACQDALEMQIELGDQQGQASTLDSIGYIRYRLGDYDESVSCYQRALGLTRGSGDRHAEATILTHLADTHQATNDLDSARDLRRQALTILDELDHADATVGAADSGPESAFCTSDVCD